MKTAREWSKEYWGAAWMVSDERAIEARDAEHRAELLKVQDDLLQAANREVMSAALIERLRGELGEAEATIELLKRNVQLYWDGENAARRELAEAKRALGEIQDCTNECYLCDDHRDAPQLGGAPPPAESTPVQRPRCGGWRQMEPPERAHLNERTFCDIEESSAGPGCKGTCPMWEAEQRPAPPDDIRERLERLEKLARSIESGACALWVAERDTRQRIGDDHERRLAALEAKGEPGTLMHYFSSDGKKRCEVCGLPEDRPCHPKGAKP